MNWGTKVPKRIETPVEMADCAGVEDLKNGSGSVNLLCPELSANSSVRGKFGDEYFDYIEITVKGCNLGDQCLPDDQVAKNAINFYTTQSLPNLSTDASQSINNFLNN